MLSELIGVTQVAQRLRNASGNLNSHGEAGMYVLTWLSQNLRNK